MRFENRAFMGLPTDVEDMRHFYSARIRGASRFCGAIVVARAARSAPVPLRRRIMPDFEADLPPMLESNPAPAPPRPGTSLLARLLNVLAIPGQVFEEVRATRHSVWNWLVPVPVYAVSLALFTVVFFSIPTILKMWTEQQAKMRLTQASSLADAVKAGTVKQADADQTVGAMDSLLRPRVVKTAAMAGGSALAWRGFAGGRSCSGCWRARFSRCPSHSARHSKLQGWRPSLR